MVDLSRRSIFAVFSAAAFIGNSRIAHAQVVSFPSLDDTIAFVGRDDAVALIEARVGFLTLAAINARLAQGHSIPDEFVADPRTFMASLGASAELSAALTDPNVRQAALDKLKSGGVDIDASNRGILQVIDPLAELFGDTGIDPQSSTVQESFQTLVHAERANVALFGTSETGVSLCRSFPFEILCKWFL